jgi:hypothetical protein
MNDMARTLIAGLALVCAGVVFGSGDALAWETLGFRGTPPNEVVDTLVSETRVLGLVSTHGGSNQGAAEINYLSVRFEDPVDEACARWTREPAAMTPTGEPVEKLVYVGDLRAPATRALQARLMHAKATGAVVRVTILKTGCQLTGLDF